MIICTEMYKIKFTTQKWYEISTKKLKFVHKTIPNTKLLNLSFDI